MAQPSLIAFRITSTQSRLALPLPRLQSRTRVAAYRSSSSVRPSFLPSRFRRSTCSGSSLLGIRQWPFTARGLRFRSGAAGRPTESAKAGAAGDGSPVWFCECWEEGILGEEEDSDSDSESEESGE